MKTAKQVLLAGTWLAVLAYGILTTIRIRRLEAQAKIQEMPQSRTYAFDESFTRTFGQSGKDAVERVLRRGVIDTDQLMNEIRLELAIPK